MTTAGTRAVVNTGKGKMDTDLKKSRWVWRPKAKVTISLSQRQWIFHARRSFKLLDESQVVLRAPRKDDVYNLDLKNIVPSGDLVSISLATMDETSEILEFKNHAMNELCAKKGIKREFSVARTPQQNGVAERKNRTLIEAARTMLADSLLPIPFWAEAVNTACYLVRSNTPIRTNAGESSFVYLGGKIPIDASTLPNVDLPIDSNMHDLKMLLILSPNDEYINEAYDEMKEIHKDHPKGQILGDPTSAVQTRGKIQKDSSAQQALCISYGTIEEEVYVPFNLPSFVDHAHPNKVYKVIKSHYCYHQAPRAWKGAPLFDSILVQQTKDEGEASERPSDSQPIPSHPHPSQEAKERSQTTYHTSQSLDEECCTEDKTRKEDFFEDKGGTKGDGYKDEGRTSVYVMKRRNADKEVSAEAPISTVKPNEVPTRELKKLRDQGPTSNKIVVIMKPLSKIDPKDKGKKMIDEEGECDTESNDIIEAEKNKEINAARFLPESLQKEEREKFTIEQRAKFLHDTIAAQRKFLAQQRSEAIK
ncbi:ribonuclease H-like domain-containing protein [Tanacetum coccineum]